MPYVRLDRRKPWHAVEGNSPVTLCNAPTSSKKAIWTKRLREHERMCINCFNIRQGIPPAWTTQPYDEEKGKAKLEAWKEKLRSDVVV